MEVDEGPEDICVLAQMDWEINGGDNETDESGSDESKSLSGSTADDQQDKEFNLNWSFTGGYLPNTDISRVDKGQGNPQFVGV